MKKLKGILRSCLIAFVGCVVALNFMASPAQAVELGDSGQFAVQANNEVGTPATFTGSDSYADYLFQGYGEWTWTENGRYVDACGLKDYEYQDAMTYPQYDAFSLVAYCDKHNLAYQICRNPRLQLLPGETCFFKMNDSPGGYWNNSGTVTVLYQRMN